MVSRLQEIDAIVADEVDYSMFLRQSSRPCARGEIFQWFRFADAIKRIA